MPTEGQTATGPNGEKAVFRGGQWVIQPSAAPRAVSIPLSPQKQAAESRAAEDQTFDRQRVSNENVRLQNEVRAAQNAADKAARDAAEWNATHNPDGSLKAKIGPGQSRSPERLAQIKTVLGTVSRLRDLAQKGGAVGGASEYVRALPFFNQNRRNVEGALQQIEGDLIQQQIALLSAANGGNGVASLANSENEARRMAASIANLDPNQSLNEFLSGLDKAESYYLRQAAPEGQVTQEVVDQYLPERDRQYAAQRFGITQGGNDGEPPAAGNLTSQGRFVDDPGLRGANATVRQMIERGATAAQVRGYLDSIRPGYGSQVNGIEEAVADYRQNPDNRRSVNIDLEKVWQPASGLSQTLGDIGMSPVGAALIGAGDTASFGLLDNLTDNPAATRAVQAGLQEQNPGSYLTGQILGGVSTGLGGELALGRAGVGASRGLVADALMGAGYGAGSADAPDDSRIASALLGGGAGIVGNRLGTGVANLAGRAATGIQDASRRALADAGVSMTPGQLAGGTLQRVEDRLAGLPFLGDAITARRREGVTDFNRAVMDEALAPIGGTTGGRVAEPGAQAAQEAVSQAYRDALGGVNVNTDPTYVAGANQLAQRVQNIPRLGPDLYSQMSEAITPMIGQGGAISGDAMQDILQGVRTVGEQYRGGAMTPADPLYATHVRPAVDEYTALLEDLVERQAPGTIQSLRAANAANRNVSTVGDAVISAANRGGEFMPSQLMAASRRNSNAFGGRRATASGNGPLFDIARAGQEVLPSQIPDSGTAGRLLIPLAAGSLAGGGAYAAQGADDQAAPSSTATALITAALLGTPYSRPSVSVINRALAAERPELIQNAGQALIDNSRIAGLLAAPSAVLYTGE